MEGLSGRGSGLGSCRASRRSGKRVDADGPVDILDLLLTPVLKHDRHLAF